jgi:hypothetical protein
VGMDISQCVNTFPLTEDLVDCRRALYRWLRGRLTSLLLLDSWWWRGFARGQSVVANRLGSAEVGAWVGVR